MLYHSMTMRAFHAPTWTRRDGSRPVEFRQTTNRRPVKTWISHPRNGDANSHPIQGIAEQTGLAIVWNAWQVSIALATEAGYSYFGFTTEYSDTRASHFGHEARLFAGLVLLHTFPTRLQCTYKGCIVAQLIFISHLDRSRN